MTIQDGCLAEAADVLGALKSIYTFTTVTHHQQAIEDWTNQNYNTWGVNCNTYCLVYGKSDASQSRGTVQWEYRMNDCLTNFSSNFPVVGQVSGPQCGYCSDLCGLCAAPTNDTNYNYFGYWCVCTAGTAEFGVGRNGGARSGFDFRCVDCNGVISGCCNCTRAYADCYRLCFSICMLRCASACTRGWQICFGFGATNFINCSASSTACTSFYLPPTLYELKKVPNTLNCYCFFINSAFQCCIPGMGCTPTTGNCSAWYLCMGADTCSGTACGRFYITCIETCYVCPGVGSVTCPFTFPEAYNYVLLTPSLGWAKCTCQCCAYSCSGGTDNFAADLLCSDYTFLCSISPNTLTKLTNPITTYRLRLYNCCICSNSGSACIDACCAAWLGGWALSGVCING